MLFHLYTLRHSISQPQVIPHRQAYQRTHTGQTIQSYRIFRLYLFFGTWRRPRSLKVLYKQEAGGELGGGSVQECPVGSCFVTLSYTIYIVHCIDHKCYFFHIQPICDIDNQLVLNFPRFTFQCKITFGYKLTLKVFRMLYTFTAHQASCSSVGPQGERVPAFYGIISNR